MTLDSYPHDVAGREELPKERKLTFDEILKLEPGKELRWRNSSTVSSIFHSDVRCIISTRYKRVHAFLLWVCYFSIALDDYIFGPTFNDLMSILGVDFSSIAYFTIIRQVAYTFGGLGGIIFNYVNRQLCLVVLLLLSGLTLYLTPYSSSLSMFYIIGGFNGFASGASDCGLHVWIMEMFGAKAGPYIQGLHVFFGLGIVLAPLITSPWISNEAECGGGTTNTAKESHDLDEHRARLFIPYAIIATILAACGLALLVLFLYKRYHSPIVRKSPKKEGDNKKTKALPSLLTVGTVLGGSIMLGSYFGLEVTYFQYMASMATASPLPIHGSQSAQLESATGALYTAGGALAMVALNYFKPEHMIYVNFSVINIANVLLVFWGFQSLTIMWIGHMIIGAGFSSTFATAYTFLESQVAITNVVGSIFLFATGVGMSIFPLALTHICEHPINLIYCSIAGTNLALLVFVALHLTSLRTSKSHNIEMEIHNVE